MLSSIRKQRAVLEVERRKAREATFTEPIHCSAAEDPVEFDQLKQFLTQFYRTIYHRQAEIREILQVEPHVATHYQQLVNTTKQVTMEEFWQRYFYRCDVERLMQQWDRRDASARQARADAFAGSISSVTKLAKSWSEKAVAISSNSRHGSNNNINSNSTHGTSTTTRPKSAPVSPVSHNANTTATTAITAAPNNLLLAALQTKASDVVATVDVNETVAANLKADIPEPKTPEEEESVVFEDNSTPPRSASTTPTIPPLMNSRILDLLHDDDDDNLKQEPPKESGTAVQPEVADAEHKGDLNEVKSTTPASNAWKGLGSVMVANVSNETSNASPMLTKVTSTKLVSATSMTTITTGEMPASTPPRPTSSPVLFREWSHSTTTPPPPTTEVPLLPQLTPSSDNNSALQAPTPADDTESTTADSFHGRRFMSQEKATAQLEKLESSLTAKAIVLVPDNTTNPEDDHDKTKSTGSTLSTTESSTGARPLDDVMRDWNRSNNNKPNITTTTTTVQETTTTTSANSNASPEVEPQVTSSEENNNVKDAPASTTEHGTTSTAEAVAAAMTTTPDLEEVADSAKVEDVPPAFDEEKQHEVANAVPDEVVTEALNSSAPPMVKEELAEQVEIPKTAEVLLPEGEKTVDKVVKLDSVEKKPEDSSLTDNVKPAEDVVTSQPVAVESANSNPQDDVQSDSHEETEVLKEEPTILNTISSSDSSNSSDSASLAAIEPPTLEPAKEGNLKNTNEVNVEVPLQSSTPPSSRFTANSPSKPTRSWFLWIFAVILLACLAVMSKVAWIWATTTPDGIQFLDALCAPVQEGTTFPLESNVSDEVDVAPVQSFEAPWWAPPAYKKVAFDVVCDSTTPSEVVVPRKRIRLDWITPTRPLAQGHRKNNDQKKKKKQQPQLRRLVVTSLINKDNETVEDVLYDAWLSSAVVTATDIQTTDKKGARKTVTKLWAARDRPPISLH